MLQLVTNTSSTVGSPSQGENWENLGRVPFITGVVSISSQHSHICSVRIKNYWEVYVQSWHTVFNLPLWPEGEYNWSHLFIFLGLLLIIWTKWLSRELPEILLNFAHFSLATFPPESVFNIIHIRCRKKHIWACFTWEAPLHRTHVLGLRLHQNTSTCDNSMSALTG